jgi:hypothetical protein
VCLFIPQHIIFKNLAYRVTKTFPDDVIPAPFSEAGILRAFISITSSLAIPIGSSGIQTGRVFS